MSVCIAGVFEEIPRIFNEKYNKHNINKYNFFWSYILGF